MLTRLTVRNFKRFGTVEVDLGSPVVFIGPNNSGKTSVMQALVLWDIGLKRWNEKRAGKSAPDRRPGVTVNRKDLFAMTHPNALHLWRDLHVRDVRKVEDRQQTDNVRIDLIVEGVDEDTAWECGLEFDYANEESFYCRPLRLDQARPPRRMPVPREAGFVRVAFLPPMSGLAASELRLDQGAVNVRVGEGRTAEILRNLCYRVVEEDPDRWETLAGRLQDLLGVKLDRPLYVAERGEITMGYRERGTALDLSSSGRGLQQTLLILSYMYANPGAVMLLDEPDAHLEILRQRHIYNLISEVAMEGGNQIVAASHSEVLLNEAAGKDLVIAFVGKPHRIGDKTGEVAKALGDIGFDQYYQAEQTGWVLYLEGPTDLAMLRSFARRLGKCDAVRALERPFVHYVGNNPRAAAHHFHGLKEALPDLRGIALFDRLDGGGPVRPSFPHLIWKRREFENYLCTEATLDAYACASAMEKGTLPLFTASEIDTRRTAMREAISDVSSALATLQGKSPWDDDVKASDEVLTPVFRVYFAKLGLPDLMNKRSFHELAEHVPDDGIDPEVGDKLDAIAAVCADAMPAPER
ncbi:MAG: AAA family ATPase [Alphaproteobacteria bacterium]|nr:AAA family ATPase [Alphaproteobacteria bacterium]